MCELRLSTHPFPFAYGTIVENGNGADFSIRIGSPILKASPSPHPFAYVLVVEPDEGVRADILRTVSLPNCAVDVARDENEAVAKALQHRPQLIIVNQHEPQAVLELIQPASTVARRS